MSFLSQFVQAGVPRLPAMIALAATWAVLEVGYYATYVWAVHRMRAVLDSPGLPKLSPAAR